MMRPARAFFLVMAPIMRNGTGMRPVAAIAAGTLAVGILDLLDALVFFGLRGARPARILQSIAAGVLGPASFEAGAASAALGLVLHFVVALGIVLTFWLAAARIRALRGRPLVFGPVYGVVVYAVMNYVVIPLSASPRGAAPAGPVLLNGILIHILGVGIPAVWFRQRGLAGRRVPD
jgi:hypothetical protein